MSRPTLALGLALLPLLAAPRFSAAAAATTAATTADRTSGARSLQELIYMGNGLDSYGNCEGDCDSDRDCKDGLLCFQRDGLTKVPGCSGEGRDDVDHCYDPNSEGGDDDDDDDDDRDDDDRDDDGREDDADDGDGEVKEVVLSEGRDYDALVDLGDQEGTLGKCAGHCNTRLDCNKGLRCFKSSGSFALVPGCLGVGSRRVQYCYDPAAASLPLNMIDRLTDAPTGMGKPTSKPTMRPTEMPTSADDDRDDDDRDDDGREDDADDGDGEVKEVVLSEGRDYDALVDLGDQEGTLGKCAGHCNTRLDCNKGLRCFKSSGSFALVPGCLGVGSRRVQYCYDPAAASLPLNMIDRLTDAPTGMGKPTSKPTMRPTEMPTSADDDRDDDDRDDDGREDDADDGDGEVKEVVLSEGRDYDALVDLGDQEGTLGKCAGHCNTRLDCNKGLRCFKSSGSFALVPGCLGVGSRRVQYCYDPAAASLPLNMIDRLTDAPTGMGKPTSKPTMRPTEMPTSAPVDGPAEEEATEEDDFENGGGDYVTLVDIAKDPTGTLGKCAGDCDSDVDCNEGLVCNKRKAFEAIPGCIGAGSEGWDYCYDTFDETDVEPEIFWPTRAPTLSPTFTPTSIPTARVTSTRTSGPTISPMTSAPTSGPTSKSTSKPTSGPTTKLPSNSTSDSTSTRTSSPTRRPTVPARPTPVSTAEKQPDRSPTIAPTNARPQASNAQGGNFVKVPIPSFYINLSFLTPSGRRVLRKLLLAESIEEKKGLKRAVDGLVGDSIRSKYPDTFVGVNLHPTFLSETEYEGGITVVSYNFDGKARFRPGSSGDNLLSDEEVSGIVKDSLQGQTLSQKLRTSSDPVLAAVAASSVTTPEEVAAGNSAAVSGGSKGVSTGVVALVAVIAGCGSVIFAVVFFLQMQKRKLSQSNLESDDSSSEESEVDSKNKKKAGLTGFLPSPARTTATMKNESLEYSHSLNRDDSYQYGSVMDSSLEDGRSDWSMDGVRVVTGYSTNDDSSVEVSSIDGNRKKKGPLFRRKAAPLTSTLQVEDGSEERNMTRPAGYGYDSEAESSTSGISALGQNKTGAFSAAWHESQEDLDASSAADSAAGSIIGSILGNFIPERAADATDAEEEDPDSDGYDYILDSDGDDGDEEDSLP